MQLTIEQQTWARKDSFATAHQYKNEEHVLWVGLHDGAFLGEGEGVPYQRYGESLESCHQQLVSVQKSSQDLESAVKTLPYGSARNALDCALWDLKRKKAGQSWAESLEQPPIDTGVITSFTIGLGTPESMAAEAQKYAMFPRLKVKLDNHNDGERLSAIREVAPDAEIIVDANEAWDEELYTSLLPRLQELDITLIEQPFPAGQDQILAELPKPIPLCADESCHITADLSDLKDCYTLVNIKLDKTGGIREAQHLFTEAKKQGFGIMLGSMGGTSLSMQPLLGFAKEADFVDLDTPFFLAEDRKNGLQFSEGFILPPDC